MTQWCTANLIYDFYTKIKYTIPVKKKIEGIVIRQCLFLYGNINSMIFAS